MRRAICILGMIFWQVWRFNVHLSVITWCRSRKILINIFTHARWVIFHLNYRSSRSPDSIISVKDKRNSTQFESSTAYFNQQRITSEFSIDVAKTNFFFQFLRSHWPFPQNHVGIEIKYQQIKFAKNFQER